MNSWFLVVSKKKCPGNFDFDTTSDTLVSNATFPGSFVFAAITKFKLFYGCPRPFQSPTREASRPTQRGGLGGRSPPSERKVLAFFWLSKKCMVQGRGYQTDPMVDAPMEKMHMLHTP